MRNYPQVDTLFNPLLSFQHKFIEDANKYFQRELVEEVHRLGHPESLPCKSTHTRLGGMHRETFSVSYVGRFKDQSLDVKTFKTSTHLIKRTSRRLAEEVLNIPNCVLLAFRSNRCGLNTWTAEACSGILLNKWSAGMLEWLPENECPRGLTTRRDLSMMSDIHKIPGHLRAFLNVPKLVENYIKRDGHLLETVLPELAQSDKEIILLDDTLNTGFSLAFQTLLLQTYNIQTNRIHLLCLINEQGQINGLKNIESNTTRTFDSSAIRHYVELLARNQKSSTFTKYCNDRR